MGYLARYRGIAGACALIGILFYSALIPLHVVSQATTALLDTMPAGHLSCHEGPGRADQASNERAPKAPTSPQKQCPFCQGYAAFQFAIAPALTIGIVRVAVRTLAPQLISDWLVSASLRPPQSRGPPTFPA
jgi:hypothetical protein